MEAAEYFELKQKTECIKKRVEEELSDNGDCIVREFQRWPIAIYYGVIDFTSPRSKITYNQIMENDEDWCVEFLLSQVI